MLITKFNFYDFFPQSIYDCRYRVSIATFEKRVRVFWSVVSHQKVTDSYARFAVTPVWPVPIMLCFFHFPYLAWVCTRFYVWTRFYRCMSWILERPLWIQFWSYVCVFDCVTKLFLDLFMTTPGCVCGYLCVKLVSLFFISFNIFKNIQRLSFNQQNPFWAFNFCYK